MKKYIVLFSVLGLFFNSSAQKIDANDVPNGVARTFKVVFPDAFNAFWQKADNTYICDFTMNETKTKAFFGINGELLNREWNMLPEYLPKKIKDTLAIQYKGFKIKQVDMVRKETESENRYRIIIAKKKDTQTLFFNLKGEMIKDEEKKS